MGGGRERERGEREGGEGERETDRQTDRERSIHGKIKKQGWRFLCSSNVFWTMLILKHCKVHWKMQTLIKMKYLDIIWQSIFFFFFFFANCRRKAHSQCKFSCPKWFIENVWKVLKNTKSRYRKFSQFKVTALCASIFGIHIRAFVRANARLCLSVTFVNVNESLCSVSYCQCTCLSVAFVRANARLCLSVTFVNFNVCLCGIS